MASGTWSETNKPIRPGFYNRFKAAALERIATGPRGIVAMPVKANWGPSKKVTTIKSEKDLIDMFGSDGNYTAYRLGRLALLGGPKELLLYRLTDGNEKVASITLNDSASAGVLKLDTKYPTTRDFKVSVRTNIVDDTAKDIVLYEGTKLISVFPGLKGTTDEIASSINGNEKNEWLVATKMKEGTLENVATANLTGGNDGTSGITNAEYIEAMAKFEGHKLNGFTLDGITDAALHTSVKSWIERNRLNGKKVRSYIGGAKNEKIADANTRSKSFNYEGIVNVGGAGGIIGDTEYTPAETAVYICALAEGQDMRESLCNESTIFTDVTNHLSNEEIVSALEAGTLVIRYDNGAVVIEDDVNTLKSYGEGQNSNWGYIRGIKFMDMVDEDTSLNGNRTQIGKVINSATGRLAVLTSLKLYFETLQAGELIEDFTVQIDEELQANAKNDEFYWLWDARYINVMKKIMGTGYIR